MKEIENQAYNKIKKYLNSNKKLLEYERKFLCHYAANLYENDIDYKQSEKPEDLINDLNFLYGYISAGANTSLNTARKQRIIDLLHKLKSESVSEEVLLKISYEIEKLFYEMDLSIRNNSLIANHLDEIIGSEVKTHEKM